MLDWSNPFHYGSDVNNVAKVDTRSFERWFKTDEFERVQSRGPNSFHRRVFPTRIDGVRRDMMNQWNVNMSRSIKLTKKWARQVRMDALHVANRSQMDSPNRDPFSTNFGRVTGQTVAFELVDGDENLTRCRGVGGPVREGPRRVVDGNDAGDEGAEGEGALGEHVDDGGEIFDEGVAGAEDVELLLDEETGFVRDRLFGVADVDDAAGEGDLLDRGAEGLGQADGFDDDVGTEAGGHLFEGCRVEAVHRELGAGLAGEG